MTANETSHTVNWMTPAAVSLVIQRKHVIRKFSNALRFVQLKTELMQEYTCERAPRHAAALAAACLLFVGHRWLPGS